MFRTSVVIVSPSMFRLPNLVAVARTKTQGLLLLTMVAVLRRTTGSKTRSRFRNGR